MFLSGKKCTYGMKCKFYHPERINQTQRSVADELRENARYSPTTSTTYLEDKKTRKHSVAEISTVDTDGSSLQKRSLERTISSQKAKAMDKNALKQYYSNGSSEWFSPTVNSKDSLSHNSYDSGVEELWSSMPNSFCEPSLDSIQYTSCNQQIPPGCQHRPDLDSDPRKHFSSHKMVQHGSHSAPYFLYNQTSPWSPQNMTHHMYRGEPSQTGPTVTRSLPPEYRKPTTHVNDFWSDSNVARSQSSYQQYLPIQPSSNDFHQWPNQEQYTAERISVRTKLCAIFNHQLVDAVMKMHPQQMDPQLLAGEIFNYKSQIRM